MHSILYVSFMNKDAAKQLITSINLNLGTEMYSKYSEKTILK